MQTLLNVSTYTKLKPPGQTISVLQWFSWCVRILLNLLFLSYRYYIEDVWDSTASIISSFPSFGMMSSPNMKSSTISTNTFDHVSWFSSRILIELLLNGYFIPCGSSRTNTRTNLFKLSLLEMLPFITNLEALVLSVGDKNKKSIFN